MGDAMNRSLITRIDVALGVVLAGGGIVIATLIDKQMHPESPLDAWGSSLIAAAGLALVIRRRAPVVAVLVAGGATTLYLLLGYSYGPIMTSLFIAVYGLARYRPPRQSAPIATAVLAVLLTHLLTDDQSLNGALGLVPGSAWVAVPYAIGLSVWMSAHAREQERARHVSDERMRIAQDVHDIVGHTLAAIKVQADVALHVMHKTPAQAETALRAIAATSGDALNELRITLADLTSDAGDAPTPGIARLDELSDRMRAAGLRIHLERSGTPRTLPTPVEVATYRVLQEAMTNVLRHSPTSRADIHVCYRDDGVAIRVSNPLPRGFRMPNAPAGMGLAGMRRRTESLGGRFSAAITADDAFQVTAELPAPETS